MNNSQNANTSKADSQNSSGASNNCPKTNCPINWMTHRISYGETDAMGIVYYANYMHFFERARNEYIRARGMSYATVEDRGIFLPVREASARYRKPVHYDDLLNISCRISEMSRASMTFQYEIFNEDKTILHTTGFTQHAVVNPQGRPVATPDWLRELL